MFKSKVGEGPETLSAAHKVNRESRATGYAQAMHRLPVRQGRHTGGPPLPSPGRREETCYCLNLCIRGRSVARRRGGGARASVESVKR